MFYVYEWFVIETGEIFYVGKGTGLRYKVKKHNKFFNDFIKRYDCDSRIIREFDEEKFAFEYEYERVKELKAIGQCACNIYEGGFGGDSNSWTEEKRDKYSKNNVMKSSEQRERMRTCNPMKNSNTVDKVKNKLYRAVVIDGVEYKRALDAAERYGVTELTIRKWVKNGSTSSGKECHYKDGMPIRNHIINNVKYDKKKHSKPVSIDNMIFESLIDAANYLGATQSNLRTAIKRDNKYKGHVVKYANQQPSCGNTYNSTAEGSTTNE